MRNKEGLIIIIGFVVLAIIVVAAVFLLSGNSGQDSSALNSLLGKPAPDFTLESYDGKKITLSKFTTKEGDPVQGENKINISF